jgi:uncharacterized repeat protein (TIGR03803 family)
MRGFAGWRLRSAGLANPCQETIYRPRQKPGAGVRLARRGIMRLAAFALASLLAGTGAHAQTLTTLYSFSGPDGALSYGGLIAGAGGNLLGTTAFGGDNGGGTIFRIGADGTGLTTLHSFSGPDGTAIYTGLTADGSGNLFGTANSGGASGQGTIFRIGADGSGFTLLHSFSGLDGASPFSGLVADGSGNLFGTTIFDLTTGLGTVFRIGADGTGFTVLHNFSGPDGAYPFAGLVADGSGNLFGTTQFGGTSDRGTIFRIGADGSGFTTLHSFSGPDGSLPSASLMADGSGNLFGTTGGGGASDRGTIFRIGADGSGFTTLYSFSGLDGNLPQAGLIADAGGKLFGTTRFGGASGRGTIFRIGADGSGFTSLYSFSGPDGWSPTAALVADAKGNLFGTTETGGPNGEGAIFRLSGAGFAVIPEPGTWAMMIAGFGLVGAGLRVRRRREMALDHGTVRAG